MSNPTLLLRSIRCVGQFYLSDELRKNAESLEPGDILFVFHEEDNEHDPIAAVVMDEEGNKVGYIPKESSPACVLFCTSPKHMVYAVVTGHATKGQRNPLLDVIAEEKS